MCRLSLLFIIILCSNRPSSAEEKPASYSLERYSVIWKKSMFGRTASDRRIPNSSIYWTLAGVFSYNGGKGAVIVNQATGAVEQIELGNKNEAGLTLLDVMEDKETGLTIVKVDEKGKTFFVTREKAKLPNTEKPISNSSILATRRGKEELKRSVVSQ